MTDYDGRCMQLYPEAAPGQKREDLVKLQAGQFYKVVFKTKDYFESTGRKCFYPWVEVPFPSSLVRNPQSPLSLLGLLHRSPSKLATQPSTTTYHFSSVHFRTPHTGGVRCRVIVMRFHEEAVRYLVYTVLWLRAYEIRMQQ